MNGLPGYDLWLTTTPEDEAQDAADGQARRDAKAERDADAANDVDDCRLALSMRGNLLGKHAHPEDYL